MIRLFPTMLLILMSLTPAFAANVGEVAPNLSLTNQDGVTTSLHSYQGRPVILYFYPKDETPGCTKQACSLRDNYGQFQKWNTVILGISRQSAESHKKFKANHKLPFDLISDEKGKIAEALGVGLMPLIGLHKRQTIVIDRNGKVAAFFPDVDPETHSAEVLKVLEKLPRP